MSLLFSFIQAGGPSWEVPLGSRDSRSASLSGSNNNIPAPNNTFDSILSKFKRQGLDLVDLIALSGKCYSFFFFLLDCSFLLSSFLDIAEFLARLVIRHEIIVNTDKL